MQRFILFLTYTLIAGNLQGQSLKKYAVGNSGCSAYFFCDPGTFDFSKSPDSSEVFTGECINSDLTFGIICVKLKDKMSDLDAAESTLVSYLDYLKNSYGIVSAAGYGKGHKLKNREDTRGMTDYWVDKDKANWKVKGWTDCRYIVVMYSHAKNDLPETKVNVFLDGLQLPE